MRYRPEIDGLRSLAILPVVAFHSGISGVAGGFTGVDIFFVISGYLITGIILSEIAEDDFSILTFYKRRCLRILPALSVVLAATAVAGFAFMLPIEFLAAGRSIVATALFVSNIHFWRRPATSTPRRAEAAAAYLVARGRGAVLPLFPDPADRRGPLAPAALPALDRADAARLVRAERGRAGGEPGRHLLPAAAADLGARDRRADRGGRRAGGQGPRGRGAAAAIGLLLIGYGVFGLSEASRLPGLERAFPLPRRRADHRLWRRHDDGRPAEQRPLGLCRTHLLFALSLALAGDRLLPDAAWRHPGYRRDGDGHRPLLRARGAELPFRRDAVPLAAVPGDAGAARARGRGGGDAGLGGGRRRHRRHRRGVAVLSGRGAAHRRLHRLCRQPGWAFQFGTAEGCSISGTHGEHGYDAAKCLALRPDRKNVIVIGDSHASAVWRAISLALPGTNVMEASVSGCRPLLDADGAAACRETNNAIFRDFLPGHPIDGIILVGRWRQRTFPRSRRRSGISKSTWARSWSSGRPSNTPASSRCSWPARG